ncbi:DsbA family protein [Stigmatella sp. ncwal1]|uniref:DsbA family protein n=1 Tax=Stigmatella ashevillensis TaxID=2995309 RepID=A0ABT5DAV5_9BACT|nr:DsbA family protein [Stigmatella ashevillena]MDC0710774.1 DsbA family protein [Stigmatella ashevillena]
MSLRIRLYSDFVCPFCFIAEQSVLLRLRQEYAVDVEWRGFELHPETPPGGTTMERLFPGRSQAMRAQVEGFAEGFGFKNMQVPERINNTRRALAVAEWARDQGRLEAFHQVATDAYWRHNADLEDPAAVARLAAQAGLSPEEARQAMDAPEYLARVDALRVEATAAGVKSIPTFFIGDARVVGCQPYEVLAAAVLRAGATPRT